MKCAFESIYEQSESKAWPSSSPSFTQSPSAVAVITAIASRLRAAIVVAAARHADDDALKVVDPVYEPLVGDLFACLTPGSSGAMGLGELHVWVSLRVENMWSEVAKGHLVLVEHLPPEQLNRLHYKLNVFQLSQGGHQPV